jgi:hypothetical protein
MAESTSERLVDSRKSLARVARHTDAALLPTEPATLSSTPSTANLYDTMLATLSNTLPSIY